MTVADLIAYLQTMPQTLPVAYRLSSAAVANRPLERNVRLLMEEL